MLNLFRLLYTSGAARQRKKSTKGKTTMSETRQAEGSAKLFRWSDLVPEQLNPLLTRQYVTGEKAMLSRIMLKKGCIVPEHSHPNEQISLIISGALEFVVSGVPVTVRAGEILVIPADAPHMATALEDTENLDLFAPPRQDWIAKDDGYLR